MWIVQPGRQLLSEQLACRPFCESQTDGDLFFGEPRYDPDAIPAYPDTLVQKATDDVRSSANKENVKGLPIQKPTDDVHSSPNKENVRVDQHCVHPLAYYNTQTAPESANSVPEAARQLVQEAADDCASKEKKKERRLEVSSGDAGASQEKEKERHVEISPGDAAHTAASQDMPGDAGASQEKTKERHVESSPGDAARTDLCDASEPNSDNVGLLKRCQGLWYSEEGQKIGSIEDDHIVWCEHTFDGDPCKLTATSDVTLAMEMDGETHIADLHEGPSEKLVWSDGEVWLRKRN